METFAELVGTAIGSMLAFAVVANRIGWFKFRPSQWRENGNSKKGNSGKHDKVILAIQELGHVMERGLERVDDKLSGLHSDVKLVLDRTPRARGD
jgi:hypothetical protein